MALEPGSGRRSVSPEGGGSSGRDSPLPRQWRNQLGADEVRVKDKNYRKYAAGMDRALSLFETALQEWADYISFLNRLLKALQARQSSITTIPAKAVVAKRLSQCLNPSLPSGVHQKALEVYAAIFTIIGRDNLSRDLPLYLPGLAPTLSFASLSVRAPFLDLLERHVVRLEPRSLRPAVKSIILALLPGLEEETSEDFDRTMKLLERFKVAIRPPESELLGDGHATGDDYFWQCFFLAAITSQSRRPGALAYLARNMPRLAPSQDHPQAAAGKADDATAAARLAEVVTSPEPGLLLRCLAAGLGDEQLLIQRGFLDLLVTHVPLNAGVLQNRVQARDLELLLRAAVGVVVRRDMSLNRRLWTWLLGPDLAHPESEAEGAMAESPTSSSEQQIGYFSTKTNYFEQYGLQPLSQALLAMIKTSPADSPLADRVRPYRICLSLMDRWEIGGLVVSELFLPVIDSVRKYKSEPSSNADFGEVLRSASVFFDGVESGLIYGEIVGLLADATGPGGLDLAQRMDKLGTVTFILSNFNVREEEMVTVHAPLAGLAGICMLEDAKERILGLAGGGGLVVPDRSFSSLASELLAVVAALLELIPERAFPAEHGTGSARRRIESDALALLPAAEILKRIRAFYVNEQGNIDSASCPFGQVEIGELALSRACSLVCDKSMAGPAGLSVDGSIRIRVLNLLLAKLPSSYSLDRPGLLSYLKEMLQRDDRLSFGSFSSILSLTSQLYSAERISAVEVSGLVAALVRRAWPFLSPSEPKYHVETTRCLWRLQSALSPANREIEAAISNLMIEGDAAAANGMLVDDPGRTFAVLWTHSLQDSSGSHPDRRGPRATPLPADTPKPRQQWHRIGGSDYYHVMLTRPLFLLLDSLLDERSGLFMTTKAWLNSLVGMEQLLQILISKLADLPFLSTSSGRSESQAVFTEEDDLDLCLYYLRTFSNILRWAPDSFWDVLAHQTTGHDQVSALRMSGLVSRTGGGKAGPEEGGGEEEEEEVILQDLFVRVCMRCITGRGEQSGSKAGRFRINQLQRCALTVLHQLLLNSGSRPVIEVEPVNVLIERLVRSLEEQDPYVQVLLLDVVFAMVRLGEGVSSESTAAGAAPAAERQRVGSGENPAAAAASKPVRLSVSNEARPKIPAPLPQQQQPQPQPHQPQHQQPHQQPHQRRQPPPPPALLKCIQAGLSSGNSRPVLDSWVSFLTECLPLYSESIFQVLIPLVETLCQQIGLALGELRTTFGAAAATADAIGPYDDGGDHRPYHDHGMTGGAPDSTLISLINGLERVLARAHDQLLVEETRTQASSKSPDQPQSFFGNMVSGVFASDAAPQSRSATANDRLTVHLGFQDAVRTCFDIWSWGQAEESSRQGSLSTASFKHTSLRIRNRARRLLEHLFAAEPLECLETIIEIWRRPGGQTVTTEAAAAATPNLDVFNLLSALDGSRPKHTIPAIFNAIYSRTNPAGLVPGRKSTLTISLSDTDLVVFLVAYGRSLDDDAMDEIWPDCMAFLRDLLANPFPHRQALPRLLEFAAVLGEKVDNTNFGEQRKMRRELGDLFLRLLTALFTTRPITFTDSGSSSLAGEKGKGGGIEDAAAGRRSVLDGQQQQQADRTDDVVAILASVIPSLHKILIEPDRVLAAAGAISGGVIGPTLRSKGFPETVSRSTLRLLTEMSRLAGNQKNWKRDVSEAFNDGRFFGMRLGLVEDGWLPLLRHWTRSDKERMSEMVGRISGPSTAGIVFGVGATSARLEADRKTQLNLRRVATLILASAEDGFVAELGIIFDKLVELLAASTTSSPSSTTRAEVFMTIRALVLRTSPIHLAMLWPVVSAELDAAISSVASADHSAAAETYNNPSVLQACKLLDLLICVAPDDFQLHEWLFVTDTIDAVYRSSGQQHRHHNHQSVALVDELSEELGTTVVTSAGPEPGPPEWVVAGSSGSSASSSPRRQRRRQLLLRPGGISDEVSLERKDELVAKVLRPFFGQLSIYSFESTYAMGVPDREGCVQAVLRDLFDERTIVRAL